MTMMEIIRGMCAFPQRGPCTESERKASQFVFDVMRDEGLAPRFYEFTTWPSFYFVYAGHLVLMLFFGSLAFRWPLLSMAANAILLASFYGDLTTRWYWLRRLFVKGRSRHVIGSFGPEDAARILVLSGHVDAGQTSFIFKPENLRRQTRFFKRMNTTWAQYQLLFFGLTFMFLFALIRLAGGTGALDDVFYAIGVFACLTGTFLHLSMWGKGFSTGANDNASAVAVAIETARRLKANPPPDTKVMVIAFGAEESMMAGSGMTVKRMFDPKDRERLYAINFEGVGGGTIRYGTGEGTIDAYPYDPELVAAARKTARALSLKTFTPFVIRSGGTDALPFVVNKFKAITLLGLDEDDYAPNYHWHTDTPENISERSLEEAVTIAMEMVRRLD